MSWHWIVENRDTGSISIMNPNEPRPRNVWYRAGLHNAHLGEIGAAHAKWVRARTGLGRTIWDLIDARGFLDNEVSYDYGSEGVHEYHGTVSDDVMCDLVIGILDAIEKDHPR